jgi:hypothetical protein
MYVGFCSYQSFIFHQHRLLLCLLALFPICPPHLLLLLLLLPAGRTADAFPFGSLAIFIFLSCSFEHRFNLCQLSCSLSITMGVQGTNWDTATAQLRDALPHRSPRLSPPPGSFQQGQGRGAKSRHQPGSSSSSGGRTPSSVAAHRRTASGSSGGLLRPLFSFPRRALLPLCLCRFRDGQPDLWQVRE